MSKLIKTVLSLIVATMATYAQDASSIGVEVGYNNHYVVNGVARNEGSPYVGIGASKSLKYADVYLGGVLLPDGDLDQSHWFVGTGTTLSLFDEVGLRADATVTRHQAGVAGIPNSTEFGVKLTLENPWLTPYVRGAFDIDLDQRGVFVGVERVQKLIWGLTITPSVEYGYVNDYKTLSAKAVLSRSFETPIGSFTSFAGVGWYDNDFDTAKYNWATREFSGDLVYNAGIKFTF